MKPSPEDNIVKLSNGTVVEFVPEFLHEAEVVRNERMYRNVKLVPNGDGTFSTEGVPFVDYEASSEACLPLLIKKIEIGGSVMEYTDEWLKKLKQSDFVKLKSHVSKMIEIMEKENEEGKKNS